jgi:hypothetical protein
LVKGFKNKDYSNGNASMAWERLRKKFLPLSISFLVKLEDHLENVCYEKATGYRFLNYRA